MIIGPTSIGKSKLALEKASELNGEIISADAFQIYKGMDIGTAKLTPSQQKGIPHHLIDIKPPNEGYSVAEFQTNCNKLIKEIQKKQKTPIICGGTALYTRAVLYNYNFIDENGKNSSFRTQYEHKLKVDGRDAIWNELKKIDPDHAKTIPPQNTRRVIRALELFHVHNRLPSEQALKQSKQRSDISVVGLYSNREKLYSKINQRVDKMISEGLENEVRTLLSQYHETAPGFQALGYKEMIDYIKGRIAYEEMIDLIKKRTRHFAKRQLTWYKKFNNVEWHQINI